MAFDPRRPGISSLSPDPFLLHLRPPPQPGRRGARHQLHQRHPSTSPSRVPSDTRTRASEPPRERSSPLLLFSLTAPCFFPPLLHRSAASPSLASQLTLFSISAAPLHLETATSLLLLPFCFSSCCCCLCAAAAPSSPAYCFFFFPTNLLLLRQHDLLLLLLAPLVAAFPLNPLLNCCCS